MKWFCMGFNQEVTLLAITCPWGSNSLAPQKQRCLWYRCSHRKFEQGMKEPNYVMKIMGTSGALVTDGCKEASRTIANKLHWKNHLHQAIPLAFSLLAYCWWAQQSIPLSPKHWRYLEDWLVATKTVCFSLLSFGGKCLLGNATFFMGWWSL